MSHHRFLLYLLNKKIRISVFNLFLSAREERGRFPLAPSPCQSRAESSEFLIGYCFFLFAFVPPLLSPGRFPLGGSEQFPSATG